MRRGKWWEMFNDPELNALEEQIDATNQSIAQAYQNYMAARALVDEARSQRFPTVTTTPSVSRSRSSATLGAGTVSAVRRQGSEGTAGTAAAGSVGSHHRSKWIVSNQASNFVSLREPCLGAGSVGRIRNTINQSRYAPQVSAADLENVRLSQQLERLRSCISNCAARTRCGRCWMKPWLQTGRRSTTRARSTRRELATGFSVVEAQGALPTAEATAIGVGLARAQSEHAIAASWQAAAEFSLGRDRSLRSPGCSAWHSFRTARRRPDIAAAERFMAKPTRKSGLPTRLLSTARSC